MVAHWDAQGAIDTAVDHPLYDQLIAKYRKLERSLIRDLTTKR
jgi:hypothetical protein